MTDGIDQGQARKDRGLLKHEYAEPCVVCGGVVFEWWDTETCRDCNQSEEGVDSEQTTLTDGGETTYKYVSLMRSKGGNPTWNDEDGDKAVFAGKQPETWMPRVIAETEDGKSVIAVCYKREALAELPEWMAAEDAFKWAKENVPDGFEDHYGQEAATDGARSTDTGTEQSDGGAE